MESIAKTTVLKGDIEAVGVHDHACLIYRTDEEYLSTVIPLIRAGIDRGERCLYLCERNRIASFLNTLNSCGIDVESARCSGAVSFIDNEASCFANKGNDVNRMLKFITDKSALAEAEGFSGLRIIGDTTWAQRTGWGEKSLIEMEARLNYIVKEQNVMAIWLYDYERISSDTILGALYTNPIVIYEGLFIKNPYYIHPDKFLQPDRRVNEAELLLHSLADNKRAVEELWSTQSKLNAMLESIGDHIIMIDNELNVIWANKTARGLFGEDIVSRKCYQTYHGRTAPCPDCIAQESFRDGKMHEHDHQVKDKSGRDLFLHCTANIVQRNGTVEAVIEISRDITDKKIIENELTRSKQTMQTILDTMPFGVIVVSKDKKIRHINHAALAMSGKISTENVVGNNCNKILCSAIRCPIQDNGIKLETSEQVLVTGSGREVPVIKSASLIEMDGEEVLLESFVDISSSKKVENELHHFRLHAEEESKISASLLALSSSVSGLLDITAISEEVVDIVLKLTSAERTAVFLREDVQTDFKVIAFRGLRPDLIPAIRELSTPMAKVPGINKLLRGEGICIDDAPSSGMVDKDYMATFAPRALAIYPLMIGKGLIGVIVAERELAFSDKAINLLMGASTIVSTAIENAMLYKESLELSSDLARRIEIVETTYAIDRIIQTALDREEILAVVAKNIQRIIPAEKLIAVLYDEDNAEYHFESIAIPLGACPLLDTVLRTGRVTSVPDTSMYRERNLLLDGLGKEGYKSIIVLPINSKEKRIGCIVMAGRRKGTFGREDIANAEKLTAQMSIALENTKLYEDVKDLFLSTVRALAHAVDAKSPWTRGHSDRVTEYAVALGREIGLSEKELERLELAGLLHDIGKIGTYDVVLDKPERLTPEEFELVKMHPSKGEEILLHIKQMKDILPAIRHHHEKIDGTGYSDGLKGKDIPLQARILCIADSYDSMTADRPYRPAPGKDYAVSELRKYAGSQFDPDLVEAFLKILKK